METIHAMSYGPVANMADGGEATPQQSQQSSEAEEPLGMRAVLIGATGAIGECLLGELLCSKVCAMGSISLPTFNKSCIFKLAPFVLLSLSKVHVLKLFDQNSYVSYSTVGCLKN